MSVARAGSTAGAPPIDVLDAMSAGIFEASMAPLFEGAPRFLRRLANARPFGTADRLFERAREIALRMPNAEQIELINAHPRLGAPSASVSAFSFTEQGYDRDAEGQIAQAAEAERAGVAAKAERAGVTAELDRLNAAYETQFGFRYCVFVAGRPRTALLPGMAVALQADRDAEITRALLAVVDIAMDRYTR